MVEIGARIRRLSRESGIDDAALAKSLGVSQRALNYYLNDARKPSYDALITLAGLFGVSVDYLLTGNSARCWTSPGEKVSESVIIDGTDFASIPRYDAQLAAGGGALNDDQPPTSSLAFRRDWLARSGISPAAACILTVRGDSMRPTLYDADLVMIDTRRTQVRDRRIYAFVDCDGEARVKRLEQIPGRMILILSDNPACQTELREGPDMNSLQLLGEVVWSAHSWLEKGNAGAANGEG